MHRTRQHRTRTRLAVAAATPLTAVALLAAGPVAYASHGGSGGGGGDRGVEATGSCSRSSDWELKAKHDDGRIELEFEVDTPRVGQRWGVSITDNGRRVFSGTRVTRAPSGSFTIELRTANRSGRDHFVASARNRSTGETCRARVTL